MKDFRLLSLSLAYSLDSIFSLAQWLTRSAKPLSCRPFAAKVWISLSDNDRYAHNSLILPFNVAYIFCYRWFWPSSSRSISRARRRPQGLALLQPNESTPTVHHYHSPFWRRHRQITHQTTTPRTEGLATGAPVWCHCRSTFLLLGSLVWFWSWLQARQICRHVFYCTVKLEGVRLFSRSSVAMTG